MNKVIISSAIMIAALFNLCSIQTNKITENEILWDSWGVPHIYATNENNLYYSFGWAQMHSHGDLIMKLYGQARGKASEYWGEEYLETDLLMHQLKLVEMSEIVLNNLSGHVLSVLQSFADGFNDYARSHPELISKELSTVLPVKPLDIIAHANRLVYLEFLIRNNYYQSQQWKPGSNAWAINSSRSQSNNPLLLANPHLPWFDFWMFYEAHLNLDELNLYGATLVGIPFIGIGFNQNLGWTHTVNTIDNVDLYEITTKEGQYLLDGKYHDIVEQIKIIRIKEDSVNYRLDTVTVKSTRHGIIVKELENKAIVLRFSMMEDPPDFLEQWYDMGKAKSLRAFEDALRSNKIPFFNVVYADKEDNILYHFGGHVPKKSYGDWNTWSGVVSGDESQNIWNKYLNYDELPTILNPENGWLQNANDPPFTSTIPTVLNPGDFPKYLAPNNMDFRAQQSANLILKDNDITFDEFIEYKHSTNSGLAERILDDLIPLKDQAADSITRAAFDVLESWDRNFDANSKAAVLFINWIQQYAGYNLHAIFETPWSFEEPIDTPDGLMDKKKAIDALSEASQSLIDAYGSLEIEYGDIYRVRVGEYDLPANGGDGTYGLFRTLYFQRSNDGRYYAWVGDSFVAAVEFGEEIRARVLLSYGNATQKGSKHIGDQLPLFAEKKLRDALISREDVEMNIEFKETFNNN